MVTTVGIKAMMQVPSGPFHIQHLSAIIFFSSMLRGEEEEKGGGGPQMIYLLRKLLI